jgi:hypothetical protein
VATAGFVSIGPLPYYVSTLCLREILNHNEEEHQEERWQAVLTPAAKQKWV